jgi:KaiC/GvpD/RAD55 family RecA-like ATPase
MMSRAEAEASPNLYLKASSIFEKAKECGVDEKSKLLALGHSCFCKALEAGRKFEATRDTELHLRATQHLEGAANYYIKADFKSGSEYAKATQRLFDAQMYMHKAKTEMNPINKTQYYRISEKLLEASAVAFMQTKNPEKANDVKRYLKSIKEEQELARTLTKVVQGPPIVSTTTSFSTPTPSHERAVGLERFKHAHVQAHLTIDMKEIRAGEDFNFKMQIANVGKEPVQLSKIENMLSEEVEIVTKPDLYRFERAHLDMEGKRLDALKTEEIRLVLRSFNKGALEINPRIIYIDETGNQMASKPESVVINVVEARLPNRISTGYNDLDDLLFGGLPQNYSIILTSPSCDEKDLLIRRFLGAGLRERQVTFLVSIKAGRVQQLAETYQSNFFLVICNPQADGIIRSLPNVFKLKGVENLTEINIALTSAFRKIDESHEKSKRVCLEIISDALLQHHAVTARRWLTGLIPDFVSKGFTVLGVMNPHMHPPQEAQAILDLFEGEISIYTKKTEKGLDKFLKIKRMHDQKYLESELLMRKEKLEM